MWIVPAATVVALFLLVLVCGLRAVIRDVRERRWIWAAAGLVATAVGAGALAVFILYMRLPDPMAV